MDPRERVKEIKAQFRLYMNGAVARSMRAKGLVYKLNFGIELPRLKEIAAMYPKDHDLAQALWKEDVRECKILAPMLQPVETFCQDIADIWVERINNPEIANLTVMSLFQYLPYAPSMALRWIAAENEYTCVCGFLIAARLLPKRPDMDARAENELLDQAFSCVCGPSYHVRQAATLLIRKYIALSNDHAFRVCRRVQRMEHSPLDGERLIFDLVKDELS